MLNRFCLPASFAAALLLAATQTATADNDALYGAAIPEDAVFVRWLAPADRPEAFGLALKAEMTAQTDYIPISAAALTGAEAGRFYSRMGAVTIAEPDRADATKVHLILLNIDGAPARLVVAGNGAEVVGSTVPGEARARGVNPVEARLSVVTEGGTLATFDLSLRRGQNLSFVVEGDSVRLIENAFGPVFTPN